MNSSILRSLQIFVLLCIFGCNSISNNDKYDNENKVYNKKNAIYFNDSERIELSKIRNETITRLDTIEQKKCQIIVLYDNKEYLDNGVVNYYWTIKDFDEKSDECWDYLAEIYYNVIPDSTTKLQKIYFINFSEKTNASNIKSIRQIEETKGGLKKIIGIAVLDTAKGSIDFKEFPYGK